MQEGFELERGECVFYGRVNKGGRWYICAAGEKFRYSQGKTGAKYLIANASFLIVDCDHGISQSYLLIYPFGMF